MKKIFFFLILNCILFSGFSAELTGKNLEAVNMAMDSRLYVFDFDKLEDKLAYVEGVEKQIKEMPDLSEEARLICKNIFFIQNGSLQIEDAVRKNKKERNKAAEEEMKKLILDNFAEFVEFEKTHENLSAHYYMQRLVAEISTLTYAKLNEQIDYMKGLLDKYKQIEEMNPRYSEILFTLSTILYFVPKVAGGSKEEATIKCKQAIEYATCNYEKSSALVMYSQILYEEKKYEESKKYLNQALALDPKNSNLKRIQKMNEDGHSMFKDRSFMKAD